MQRERVWKWQQLWILIHTLNIENAEENVTEKYAQYN
jgi:hypothetical protein